MLYLKHAVLEKKRTYVMLQIAEYQGNEIHKK